jgi:S-adenosyl methyltransferase
MNTEYCPPTAIPSPARIYDYYLGGKDNFAVDRAAAEKALSVVPHGRQVARANRRFLIRAVTLMAEQGVSQFIDLGTGFPTKPNVHQAARAVNPDARVAYIDNDPVVTAHNQALLAKDDKILALHGDIRHPHSFLGHDEIWHFIDFSQPIGVLFVAVLHFVPPEDDPEASVATLVGNMVSGSYLALSHITSDGTAPEVVATIRGAYRTASAPAVFRTRDQIHQFFNGLRLAEPGLADLSEWHTSAIHREIGLPALRFLAGIATKP